LNSRILTLADLEKESARLRSSQQKLVVTNGCFDLLHVGHIRYLEAARKLGDALAVGINGDASVRLLKGEGRPLNTERDRAEILAALRCVDFVAIFPEMRATGFLLAARPAIYVKGGDYTPETLDAEESAVLRDIGAEIVIVPFSQGYSTSAMIDATQNRAR
jgi:D-glycero-beta-D-manno-heptose 1-phosphate adenylyltransferase